MKSSWVPLGILLIASVVTAGCGKRGDPLPPLLRVPAAPGSFTVTRLDNDVYAQFTAPAVNADGVGPADVARIELYAITADRLPEIDDPEDLRKLSTLIGTEQVRRPAPPLPQPKEGIPPIPAPPPGPGVEPGAAIVIREALMPALRTPVTLPEKDRDAAQGATSDLSRPLVAPAVIDGPQRYYFVVGVSPRGRYGPATHLAPIPLGPTSSAPARPEIVVDEKTMTLRWKPPTDARGFVEPSPPDVLPSRSMVPLPPKTTFDVYEVAKEVAPGSTPLRVPTASTEAPVDANEFVQSGIKLGAERCFVVRPVDILAGLHVRGPASPMVCAPFADTFAPAPPGTLDAVSASGGISLIWEASPAQDLAGYLVLRGDGPDATLSPLITEPIMGTTHTDNTVRPGVRYAYVVVAVDKAGNRSSESNRVEETARQ